MMSRGTAPSLGWAPGPVRPGLSSTWLWTAAAVALGGVLGLGTAVGGPSAGILVALVPVGLAILLRPEWLPGALMVTVFAEAYSIGGLSISRAAGPLALFLLFLQIRSRSPATLRGLDRPLAFSVVAYVLWASASVLWTANFDATLAEGGSALAVSSLLLSGVYLVAVIVLVTTVRQLFAIVVIVWALATVMGLLAIVEFLQGSARATGVAGDANFFASLQVVAIPLGAVLASHVRTTAERAVVLGGVAVAVGSVFVSLSRGGILALLTLVLLLSVQPAYAFFRTRARKRIFLAVVAVGASVLVALSYSALSERTSSLFNTGDGGSGRANLWLGARTGIAEHPVLGLGFGAFASQSNELMQRTPGVEFSAYRLRPGGQPVHNAYLSSLVELGPLGLSLFLAMIVCSLLALRRAGRAAASNHSLFVASAARGLAISLVGFSFTSLFLSTETDRTLWVLMGLALIMPRLAAVSPAPGRRLA